MTGILPIRRLAELNAKSEDPSIWNDPQKAQDVMRKRQDLDNRIRIVLRLEQSIADNTELIELGEMEGDPGIVSEAEKALLALKPQGGRSTRSRRCCPAKPMAMTLMCRSMPAPAAPRARTGPPC